MLSASICRLLIGSLSLSLFLTLDCRQSCRTLNCALSLSNFGPNSPLVGGSTFTFEAVSLAFSLCSCPI